MKPNITNLAKHLGNSRNKFYQMQKNQPKQFKILMLGWEAYCNKINKEEE
jgi:hypothetical protein